MYCTWQEMFISVCVSHWKNYPGRSAPTSASRKGTGTPGFLLPPAWQKNVLRGVFIAVPTPKTWLTVTFFMQRAHHSWASATQRRGICQPLTNNSISVQSQASALSSIFFFLWMAWIYKTGESSVLWNFINGEKLPSNFVFLRLID